MDKCTTSVYTVLCGDQRNAISWSDMLADIDHHELLSLSLKGGSHFGSAFQQELTLCMGTLEHCLTARHSRLMIRTSMQLETVRYVPCQLYTPRRDRLRSTCMHGLCCLGCMLRLLAMIFSRLCVLALTDCKMPLDIHRLQQHKTVLSTIAKRLQQTLGVLVVAQALP